MTVRIVDYDPNLAGPRSTPSANVSAPECRPVSTKEVSVLLAMRREHSGRSFA
jgi:hypothetical protein